MSFSFLTERSWWSELQRGGWGFLHTCSVDEVRKDLRLLKEKFKSLSLIFHLGNIEVGIN